MMSILLFTDYYVERVPTQLEFPLPKSWDVTWKEHYSEH